MRKWPKCVSRKRRNGLVRTTTAVLAAVCVGSCVYPTDPVSLIVSQNLSFFHTHTLSLACRGKIGREYLWRETFADKRLAKPQGGRLRRTWCTVPSIDRAETGKERCFKFLAAALREILPSFSLLEPISRHVDVWRFVCDMQCLGADGLARFFEEFNNVTNTLVGSSESYEMSVLDIVMSTIPVLSAVGGTRSECEVGSLLNHLRGHKDLTCESLLQ